MCTPKNGPVLTSGMFTPSIQLERPENRAADLSVLSWLERLYSGVLVHIYISRNGPLLTKICIHPSWYLPLKFYQGSKTRRAFSAFFRASKRLYSGVLAHIYISRTVHYSLRYLHPSSWYLPLKSYQGSKMRWPISAFFRASKRLNLGLLGHIFASQNDRVLT